MPKWIELLVSRALRFETHTCISPNQTTTPEIPQAEAAREKAKAAVDKTTEALKETADYLQGKSEQAAPPSAHKGPEQ